MAALSGLVGKFLGVESAPIRFNRDGVSWDVQAGGVVDMGAKGAMGLIPESKEPLYIDNTGHPASNRIALARATKSHVYGLGLKWDDTSGRNHGQFAPFSWRS
jgi:hypothetical protein